MGTSAFEKLWDDAPARFDDLWGDDAPPSAGPITPGHSKFTPDQLIGRANRAVATAEDEEAVENQSYRERLGGNLANLIRDVPGAEAMTAGVHSLIHRQPYSESLASVRGAADDRPAIQKWPSRIAGGGVAMTALPGSMPMQGARYGILSALGKADPATVEDRLHGAAVGGALGAAVPAGAKAAGKLPYGAAWDVGRTVMGSKAGALSLARRASRLMGEAGRTVAKEKATPVAAPMVAGYRPIGELIERAPAPNAVRASSRGILRDAVAPQPVAAPTPAPLSKEAAKGKLAALLQKNLDEGATEVAAAQADPPSNMELMNLLEASLLRAKAARRVR